MGFVLLAAQSSNNFFTTVVDFLSSFWDFICTTVNGIANFFGIFALVEGLTLALSSNDLLFSPLVTCMSIVALVAVVKVALGWGNT